MANRPNRPINRRLPFALSQAGFGMPLALMSLIGVVVIGGAVAAYLNWSLGLTREANLRDASRFAVMHVQAVVNNDATWSSIIERNPAAFGCVAAGDCCARTSDLYPFALYDQNGAALYDPANMTMGFDLGGKICSTYPSELCPFHPMLKWQPTADGNKCKAARIAITFDAAGKSIVQINEQIDAAPDAKKKIKSGGLAGMYLDFMRGAMTGSSAEFCTNMGGFFDPTRGECALRIGLPDSGHITKYDCETVRGGSWSSSSGPIGSCAFTPPLTPESCNNQDLSTGGKAGRWDYATGTCLFNNYKCDAGTALATFDTAGRSITCGPPLNIFADSSDVRTPCASTPVKTALIGLTVDSASGTSQKWCSRVPSLPGPGGVCGPGLHLQYTNVGSYPYCNWNRWDCTDPADLAGIRASSAHSDWNGGAFGPCMADSCISGSTPVGGVCDPPVMVVQSTWAALAARHPDCRLGDFYQPPTGACNAAVHRDCQARGFAGGFGIVEANNTDVYYGCFREGATVATTFADLTGQVAGNGGSCAEGDNSGSDVCKAAINRKCASMGYAGGYGPGEQMSGNAAIDCVANSSGTNIQTSFTVLSSFHGACTQASASGMVCMSASSRFCQTQGYTSGFGPVEHQYDIAIVTCVK